jgi:Recombination endonuclease VII
MPKGVYGFRGKPAVCHPERKNYAKGLCILCSAAKRYIRVIKDQRRTNNLRRYGITEDEYYKLLSLQGNKCAICGGDSPRMGERIKYFSVDHDHNTGEIRGLLCGPCNRGIGLLKDCPVVVGKALDYLNGSNKHLINDVKR